jgi:hypothetical protein
MPTVELKEDELLAIRFLVESNIEETEQFIYDTDPARVDHQRAVQDLAILSSALPKLAWGCGK